MPRTEEGKDSIVDVYCETNDKRQFIVEMQMYWSSNFMQRVLFNSSKVYVGQLKQGEPFSKLQPVYSLNLIDDIFEPKMEEYYHYYHLVHDKYTQKVIDGFHLVFVELKKFKPKMMTERKMQVLWLRFLTEIDAYTEEVPQELLDNPEISKAIRLVEESAYTREQLLGYDMFWDSSQRLSERPSTISTFSASLRPMARNDVAGGFFSFLIRVLLFIFKKNKKN